MSNLSFVERANSPQIMRERVYLDHAATTRCDPRVQEFMALIAKNHYGNPSSSHRRGTEAEVLVNTAREQLAAGINCLPEEIIFTSGTTESNNLVIQGICRRAVETDNPKRKILALSIEHASVLEPCRYLATQGFEFDTIPVNTDGIVDMNSLIDMIDDNTLLVCVQLANNEFGTIQPVKLVADIAHEFGAWMHCDAAQALGKISIDCEKLGVDYLVGGAHKINGPKGTGCVWFNGRIAHNALTPLIFGGGQERGLRSGTLNVPAIAGFGMSLAVRLESLDESANRVAEIRDRFEFDLRRICSTISINGGHSDRLPDISSVTNLNVDSEEIVGRLDEFDVSLGSACNSIKTEGSHVLRAIGLSDSALQRTLRFSFGWEMKHGDADLLIHRLREIFRTEIFGVNQKDFTNIE